MGTVIEFDFNVDEVDDGIEHYPIIMQKNPDVVNRLVNLFQPNEEAAFPIYIYFNFDKIIEDDFRDLGESGMFR